MSSPTLAVEEEKSEQEPMKIWGHIEGDQIVYATSPSVTAQCLRVPVSDGHTAAVFASFDKKIPMEEIIQKWESYRGAAQELELPSAPKQFLHYFHENDRPQAKLDRNLENGYGSFLLVVCVRTHSMILNLFGLSHNTLRGASRRRCINGRNYFVAKGYLD